MKLHVELRHLLILLILYRGPENCATSSTGTGATTEPEFLGGSMSFEAFDDHSGDILVNAKILTGWRRDKGQCGLQCSSIGADITGSRNSIMAATGNQGYFGHWDVEEKYTGQSVTPRGVTPEVNGNISVHVMALNVILGWELDKAEVTIKVDETAEYTDLMYEGHSWTHLSKQPNITQWHMQLKVNAKQRSDTNRRNRSPIVQMTPYMTLGINRSYTLSIPTIDQDGDYFECRKTGFIEFIDLQNSVPLKNLNIQKDCFIQIDTSAPHYQVGDSAVIAATIQDFNRENIKLTGDPNPLRQRYTKGRPLSSVPVQFYIEIITKDEAPVIIDPTPPEQQMFTIFVGSDLEIKVVAKPTNPTRTVSTFFFTRRDGVVPLTSAVTDESSIDTRAKGQAVLWSPVSSDIGDHILCARVQDSVGYDSLPRCVIIRVKDALAGTGSTIVQGKPMFLRFPSNGEIACLVGSNCRFPIYAFSSTAGGITGISLTSSTAAGCHISSLKDGSTIQSGAKMVDISFQDTSIGSKKICLKASDVHAVITKCFEAIVQPKDPCEIQPCRNGAECVTNGDKMSFVCMCPAGYNGTTCDIAPDKCDPNPCKFGGTCRPLGQQFECLCTSEYVGIYCNNVLDTCRPDPCGSHGVCEDVHGGYTCHCQDGYSGNDCAVHSSSPVDPCTANSSAAGCSCSALCVAPNGICVGTKGSKTCLCSKGFSGSDCQSPTSHGPLDPKFVPPTPEDEDLIKCERNRYMGFPCILSVYTSPDLGMSSAPLVKTVLPPGKVTISISSPVDPQIAGIPNIYRFDVKIRAQSKADPKLHICLQVAKSTDQTHATDTKCFNVEYEFKHGVNPWGTHIQTNNKFVDPTLPDLSEIVCEVGKPCHFFVYASKENGSCRHVLTSDIVTTTVFDPTDLGTSCMTDVVYDFQSSAVAGTIKKLCVKSGDTGDVRCFNMRSVAAIVDFCSSNPCQNGGVCGSSQGTFVCTCTDGYTGLSCEKGPCPPTTPPHCNNGGYCYSIGTTKTCFCKLGFLGPTCTDKSRDTVASPQTNGGEFKDGTLPKEVKCYVGSPCKISTTLIGDPGTSPTVNPGYVSGELDVQKTMVTKDPASPSDYHASVEVVSKTSGHHQICIQSINTVRQSADEVCVMVHAVSGQFHLPSKLHAYFVDPTLPDGSSVECETSKPCHLALWVHNYDSEDSCPSVKSSDEASTGVYIHQATGTSVTGPCKVDVAFHDDQPKVYTNICFTATSTKQDVFGGDGEVRCYDVSIVNTLSVVGPCASTLCQNGGFCDGHQATPKCVCLSGYSGPLCSITHGESLTNPAPISGITTQTTFGDLAVPKVIKCTQNQECEIPFTFTRPGGGAASSPDIHLGHVDSGLTVTPPTLSTDPHTPAGTYHGKVKVVSTTSGNKKVCVHTPTSSPETVGDEICFDVEVSSPASSSTSSPNTNQPHFIEPTVPPNSTLQCSHGKTCHVVMHMSPGINHDCPSVIQTHGPSDDLHVFHSDSSHVIGSCAVDVTLTPPASKQGTDTLCFETSLPYIPGESRCFKVDYSPIVSGPCHGVACHHGGVCGANGQCVCPIDRSGSNCQNVGTQGPAHTSGTPKFTDMAIPTNIKCELHTECVIPLMVNGDANTLPHIHVGHTDHGVDVKSPVIHQTGNLPSGANQIVVPVTGTQLGNKRVCVQTLQTTGNGLSEHCFTVEITNPGSSSSVSTSKPHFNQPTLPGDATVTCDIGKACHVILHQTPDPVTGCPPVTADTIPGGLYVMNPASPTQGQCRTDVVFTPSSQGDNHICLTTKLPSVTGEKRCYTLHVPSTSPVPTPCESKHCKHGGLCSGDPSGSTATCSCPIGYSGPDCNTVGAHNVGDSTGNPIQPNAGSPPVVTDTAVPGTVSCVVNTVCHVPVLVTGDPNNPPTLSPVQNNPGTQGGQVNVPQTPHQIPGSPPGTYKGDVTVTGTTQGIHTSCVQTVDSAGTPTQTVCFKVNMKGPATTGNAISSGSQSGSVASPGNTAGSSVSSGSSGGSSVSSGGSAGSTTSPSQIIEPTLTDGSVIKCSKDKACHVLIHTAPTGSTCDPRVTEKGTLSGGISVFAPVKDTDGTCVTDISLPSNNVGNQHVCFQVAPGSHGGNAESRCYDLQINQDPCITIPCLPSTGTCIPGSGFPSCQCKAGYVGLTCSTAGPCSSVSCLGGGVCSPNNGQASCICPTGTSGNLCEKNESTPIPGSPTASPTDPVFVDTALPKTVTCYVGRTCTLPIPVSGTGVSPSNAAFGLVDPGITPGNVTVHPLTSSSSLLNVPVTPTQSGNKHVCVQTKTTTTNVDEICFNVNAVQPSSGVITSPPDTTKPQFTSPSLPENSVVECKVDSPCHIHLTTTPGTSDNHCPDIMQTGTTPMKNLVAFSPPSTSSTTCHTDVTISPTNSEKGDNHVCLMPTKTSVGQGKQRCITVHVVGPNAATQGGPCQALHCQNNGQCIADVTLSTAHCICASGFTGITCGIASTTGGPCSSTHCNGGGVCFVENGQASCICPSGKSGKLCQKDGSTPIAGSPAASLTDPVFVDTALPKTVTCYVGRTCTLPIPVSGTGVSPSNAAFGLVDPGITPGNVTVHPLTSSSSLLNVPVTPTQSGNKHVCVQTKTTTTNVDEICFNVNAVQPSSGVITSPSDTTKPQFTSPSLPENSVVECKVDSPCHIHLTTTPGTSDNHCPDIMQTGTTPMKNLVAFSPPSTSSTTCHTDVTISPTNSETGDNHVCLMPTKTSVGQGKQRCVTVHVVGPNAATQGGPCQALHCQNNGQCIADVTLSTAHCICASSFTGTTCGIASTTGGPCSSTHCNGGVCFVENGQASCICPSGKSGKLCQTDGSTPIAGSPAASLTDPVFVDTALPKTVTCYVGRPCTLPIPVSGTGVSPSNAAFGLVDPGITPGNVTVHPLTSSSSLLNVPVTPTQSGNKHVCVQTKTTTTNVDEICFNVNAVQPSSGVITSPPDTTKPQFTSPSLPENSVVECKVDSPCHIHLTTTPGTSDNHCPDIMQTGTTPMKNLVAFSPPSTSSTTCHTDVTISPTNSETGDNHVCLMPTKTSVGQGKQRCITVHVVGPNAATQGGPCQALHCQNNGQCIADVTLSTAHCICASSFTGTTCGIASTTGGPCSSTHCNGGGVCFVENGQASCICPSGKLGKLCQTDGSTPIAGSPAASLTDPVFVDTALPKTVTCYVGRTCTLPIPVSGTGVSPSNAAFGLVDLGITLGNVTVHPLTSSSSLLNVPVTPTQSGNKHVCVQTKTTTTNVDEICFNVNAVQPSSGVLTSPPDTTKPQFTSPSLPENSVVECKVDSQCHIHLTTTPGTSDNHCPDIMQTGTTPMKNLVTFAPLSTSNTTCHTDVTISPTNSETGDNHVCLMPTKTSGGGHGKQRCITVHVVGPYAATQGGPCQALHCQNNGQCIADVTLSTAHCICTAGFTGPTCDPASTTVDPCSTTHMVCQNGGICKNSIGHATCLCQPGWKGTHCQTDSSRHAGVPGTQPDPAFIDAAIPKVVKCVVGQSCNVPLLLKGSGVTASDIKFGPVDSGVTPGVVSVDHLAPITSDVVHVPITANTEGEKHVCIQATSPSSGTKSSEACFIVKATQPTAGGSTPPPQTKPQFTSTTLPDHSVVQCMAGSTCHIYLGTQPSSNASTCPNVVQSGVTHLQNAQTFPLANSMSPGHICHSVLSFIPAAEPSGLVCFTPIQASDHGKEKCFNITVKPENCSGPVIDFETAREAVTMGRATCKCTLGNGKEIVVINKRPKATTMQILKAASIGAGSVSGAIAIATIIYKIVGKIKDSNHANPNRGDDVRKSDRMTPRTIKPLPQPRQRR